MPGKQELDKIEKLVDEACKLACEDQSQFGEAINWGDLGCADVRYCQTRDDEFYEVFIEEAAPGCPKLCSFVFNYLKERGFENVEVRTEW